MTSFPPDPHRAKSGLPSTAVSISKRRQELRWLARHLKTSTYEISANCNLSCEGCLFFSGEHAWKHTEAQDTQGWHNFFSREQNRGVTYAFLAGAEPALAIDRIRAAHTYIPAGMIVTNGTRRIPDDIRYRIHVSLWGSSETSSLTRGANVVEKAFRNYAGDPRAVFVFTINAMNIDELGEMAHLCARHDVRVTFNYFSPTRVYTEQIGGEAADRTKYFRFSDADKNLVLDLDDYRRARAVIKQLRLALPDHVVYSLAYDTWITGQAVFDLDEYGVATKCAGRRDRHHKTFFVDRTESHLKCSNPTFDCRDCRTYASGMTSHVRIHHEAMLRSRAESSIGDSFEEWKVIFIGDQWQRLTGASQQPRSQPIHGSDAAHTVRV